MAGQERTINVVLTQSDLESMERGEVRITQEGPVPYVFLRIGFAENWNAEKGQWIEKDGSLRNQDERVAQNAQGRSIVGALSGDERLSREEKKLVGGMKPRSVAEEEKDPTNPNRPATGKAKK